MHKQILSYVITKSDTEWAYILYDYLLEVMSRFFMALMPVSSTPQYITVLVPWKTFCGSDQCNETAVISLERHWRLSLKG